MDTNQRVQVLKKKDHYHLKKLWSVKCLLMSRKTWIGIFVGMQNHSRSFSNFCVYNFLEFT